MEQTCPLISGMLTPRPAGGCYDAIYFNLLIHSRMLTEPRVHIRSCEVFCQSIKISYENGILGSLTYFISGPACFSGGTGVEPCARTSLYSPRAGKRQESLPLPLLPTPAHPSGSVAPAATLGCSKRPTSARLKAEGKPACRQPGSQMVKNASICLTGCLLPRPPC